MSIQTARPNDYLYDPLFVVSGQKDYGKAATTAKISMASFAKCPIFSSMFSDLPHHPRHQLVMRENEPSISQNSTTCGDVPEKPVDIMGVDRFRYFQSPVPIQIEDFIPELELPTVKVVKKDAPIRNRKIQTQYRESSAQTSPWQPPFIVKEPGDFELLKLDFLKWGSGLPAGMHEVRLIERARMKRAWEKTLPPVKDKASLEKRGRLIEAMEQDEWAFREQEIQDIQDLRLQLLEEMLTELHEKSKSRTEEKIENFCKIKVAEKEDKLKKLQHKTARELRKLNFKQRNVKKKYCATSIFKEHADKKSELYAPTIRHGEHPKRWHEFIDLSNAKYRAYFLGVEQFSTLPNWLDEAIKPGGAPIKLPGTRLCIRETKWTTPILKQLHTELKHLRHKSPRRSCTLLQKLEMEEADVCTPDMEEVDDWEEEVHQASVLIQTVLRGRASQVLIFDGRNRCRELIRELRSTHALQEEHQIQKFNEHLEVKTQQRENKICLKNANKLQETLYKLSGSVVGTLLDFLNKELRRLLDERKAHAMCLLAERERNTREAAEAGRRQAEIRRRREHDEMFKQVVKVHQDTVDLYLQDIITEGIDFISQEEANVYIEGLAKQIDDEVYRSVDNSNFSEREEIVASMVHNFLLPNVEKELVRENIKKKQKLYLQTAHESIYKKIERLPRPPSKPKMKKKKCVRYSQPYSEPSTETALDDNYTNKELETAQSSENEFDDEALESSATCAEEEETTSLLPLNLEPPQ